WQDPLVSEGTHARRHLQRRIRRRRSRRCDREDRRGRDSRSTIAVVAPARRGASTLGCLFTLVVVAAIGYFAVSIGSVFYRHYAFQDAMKQEARFASHRTN